jgi:hypothetical protein
MVSAARESLAASDELRVGMLEDALPVGAFDLGARRGPGRVADARL